MSQTLTDILVVIAAVFLVWLVIRLFRKPIRWILKLLLNTAIGFAAIYSAMHIASTAISTHQRMILLVFDMVVPSKITLCKLITPISHIQSTIFR